MAKTPKTQTPKMQSPAAGAVAPGAVTVGSVTSRPKACSILPDTTLGDDVALVAENMEAILSSPSYSLAQDDRKLLDRSEMRGVRMLLELGKPELAFQADSITSTVIVFGGTQIVERPAAERRLSEARRAMARAQTVAGVPASGLASAAVPASAMESFARELKRAEQLLGYCHYYDAAREFARLVSIDNQCDDKRDYVIITGGGSGASRSASTSSCPASSSPIRSSRRNSAFNSSILPCASFISSCGPPPSCSSRAALARSTRCSRRSRCGRPTACSRCRSSCSAATTGRR
jgi:hypothetical protein